MYKQIGNAVSLQLGRALGKELFNALYTQWESGRTAMPIQEKLQTVILKDYDEFEMEFEGFNDDIEMESVPSDDGCAQDEPIVISDSE
jgi:hypothetical protein